MNFVFLRKNSGGYNLLFLEFFFCILAGRLYAMERGLKIPQGERTKTTNSLLVSLMKQLEKVVFFFLFSF